MTKQQAMALLTLIADLYQIVQMPDPVQAAPPASNGRKDVKSPTKEAAAAPLD